jgi:hypothetical protein
MTEHTTEELVRMLAEAKQVEKSVTESRQKIADELAMRLECPVDGSKSHKIGDYKVVVKGIMNRKVDWEIFDKVIKGETNPPFKFKKELDIPGLKWTQENNPEFYKKLCTAITSTSGRTQVTIEEVEK